MAKCHTPENLNPQRWRDLDARPLTHKWKYQTNATVHESLLCHVLLMITNNRSTVHTISDI